MNILFVYSIYDIKSQERPLRTFEDMQFGISYISSLLKEHGHNTKLIVLSRMLGLRNYKIVENAIKVFSPDLILLDLVMPVKDGFAVLEELRADENLNKIPVIIASNLGQSEDIDRGMALGAKGYVIKSDLSLDDLVKKINSMC